MFQFNLCTNILIILFDVLRIVLCICYDNLRLHIHQEYNYIVTLYTTVQDFPAINLLTNLIYLMN